MPAYLSTFEFIKERKMLDGLTYSQFVKNAEKYCDEYNADQLSAEYDPDIVTLSQFIDDIFTVYYELALEEEPEEEEWNKDKRYCPNNCVD